MSARKGNQKVGNFKLWIGAGHINATCEDCGVTPGLEYMGLDPIFPEFKLLCSGCGTYDVMKIYLSCTKLYPPWPKALRQPVWRQVGLTRWGIYLEVNSNAADARYRFVPYLSLGSAFCAQS